MEWPPIDTYNLHSDLVWILRRHYFPLSRGRQETERQELRAYMSAGAGFLFTCLITHVLNLSV